MRVACFADCFHEVNGVAHTCRQYASFARRRGLPYLSVRSGPRLEVAQEREFTSIELPRSLVAVPIESDFSFDLLFMRHRELVRDAVKRFAPDVVHITGPGDIGILGAWTAHVLKTPLAAAWHTQLHEYAARRLGRILSPLAGVTGRFVLGANAAFYKRAKLIFAPNHELVEMLRTRTGRDVRLMPRGIDADLFHPRKRRRGDGGRTLRIGYVGRLTPEKNVRFFERVVEALLAAGVADFRIAMAGRGPEHGWLESHLRPHMELAGVLTGEPLARFYADMDVFAFPSHTDTFGNAVLEALASGVPAVVTSDGGPKYLVRSGESGFVAAGGHAFLQCVVELARNDTLRRRLSAGARAQSLRHSWDAVFEGVYRGYESLKPLPAHCCRQESQ